tara:strand:+ start:138 stop:554 length:417 start_codon:yes stop_codon:yes gene_type:complete
MALLVCRQGELQLLDKMLKDALSTDEDYILMLFSNNYTPDEDDDDTSFTEATFTDYAARTLTRATWNAAQVNATKAESSYGTAPESWTCGATGNTIYGYWMEGATSADVLWAEKFATARVLADGDVLNITPKFTLSSE